MSWLDDMFAPTNNGATNAPSAPQTAQPGGAPAMLPPAETPDSKVIPSYADFYRGLVNAKQAQGYWGHVGQYGLLGALGQTDRELAYLPVVAPTEYFKALAAQQNAQAQGLDNQGKRVDIGQTLQFLQRAGFNAPGLIRSADTGNPADAAPPLPGPSGAPVAPLAATPPVSAPVGPFAAPSPVPTGGTDLNPAEQMRARYTQMAQLMGGLPKFLPQAIEATKLGQTGAPANTIVLPNGRVADAITGQPIGMDVNRYLAARQGAQAGAEANARLPAALTEARTKADLERETNKQRIEGEAKNHVQTVDVNGVNVPVTTYDLARGNLPPGANMGLSDNPYRAEQIKQVADAQKAGGDAAVQQNAVQQLGDALKQYGANGPLGERFLGVLKYADQVHLLTPEMSKKVGAGELASMDSNAVVSAMAKAAAAGRVPLGIYNQIQKTKPGLASAQPGLMLEALNQDFQRVKEFGAFAADYYSKHENATKLDAASAFDKAHPIGEYQSRVLPLDTPAKASDRRVGFTYKNKAGQVGVWNGHGYAVP